MQELLEFIRGSHPWQVWLVATGCMFLSTLFMYVAHKMAVHEHGNAVAYSSYPSQQGVLFQPVAHEAGRSRLINATMAVTHWRFFPAVLAGFTLFTAVTAVATYTPS